MHVFLVALVPLTILMSWLRMISPGMRRIDGVTISVVPIPLLARIYMHAIPAGIALVATIFAAIAGAVPWWLVGAPLVSGAALIVIPVKYTLTDKGIRRTWGRFRRWTEFAGVERAPGGARLKPLRKAAPARIWLSGSRGDDEFLQLLRTLIRNAYQGRSGVPPFSDTANLEDGTDVPAHSLAACTLE